MKLIDVHRAFATDEQCFSYLENKRWPNGVRCTICGAKEVSKITRKSKTKNKRAQIYQCLEKTCKQQFSVTTGTIFHDSHLALWKWFTAIALIVDAKKGMSALQLSRHLRCNYRTAWYLAHRIREAMTEGDGLKLTGTVEIDETYIGGKQHSNWRKLRSKDVVMGIRKRGGDLRLIHVESNSSKHLGEQVKRHVDPSARVITDELPAYVPAFIRGLYERAQSVLKQGETGASSLNELLVDSLTEKLEQVNRRHIDEQFSDMRYDSQYHQESGVLADQFASNDAETLHFSEKERR